MHYKNLSIHHLCPFSNIEGEMEFLETPFNAMLISLSFDSFFLSSKRILMDGVYVSSY